MTAPQTNHNHAQTSGVVGVIGAYIWWGVSPLYFHLLTGIDAFEIIAHRVFWTLAFLALIKATGFGRGVYRREIVNFRKTLPYFLCGLCLMANWFFFTWAVTHGYVLETSLGYFIHPLLSVFVGVAFLHERLRGLQMVAVALAAIAVTQLVVRHGQLPWIALTLAVSWCIYGIIRKKARIDAVNGLTLELTLMLPFAIAFVGWKLSQGTLDFNITKPYEALLIVASGPITMVPLLLFGYAAPRMTLIAIGILQYISPSISFTIAVFWFEEPFDNAKLLTFLFIWAGLALYTIDAVYTARRQRAAIEASA